MSAPSQAEQLTAMAIAEFDLFHAPDQTGWVSIPVNDHRENWRTSSSNVRRWLIRSYYQTNQSPPGTQAVQRACDTLASLCEFDAPCEEVFIRVAQADGKYYLDLANELWQVVEISVDGWKVGHRAPGPISTVPRNVAAACA